MCAYRYVGPHDIRAKVADAPRGTPIRSPEDAARWLATSTEAGATYVVALDGTLVIAERRSEHVACAGGEEVLAAGEIWLGARGATAVSNQSTGYCPDPSCWPAVASALERAGLAHPGRFTTAIIFRRCPECGQRNLIKDDHYVCALCDAELPATWNF